MADLKAKDGNYYCVECGILRNKGKSRCEKCYLPFKAKKVKEHYHKYGRDFNVFKKKCPACEEHFLCSRKGKKFCHKCCEIKSSFAENTTNKYKYLYVEKVAGKWRNVYEHIKVVEETIKRKLVSKEVVHHLDFNPINNKIDNLIILGSGDHVKLHMFLADERLMFEKSIKENKGKWEPLSLTWKWLEDNKVKFIKLT